MSEVVRTWTLQTGYPLVTLGEEFTHAHEMILVEQELFRLDVGTAPPASPFEWVFSFSQKFPSGFRSGFYDLRAPLRALESKSDWELSKVDTTATYTRHVYRVQACHGQGETVTLEINDRHFSKLPPSHVTVLHPGGALT